MMSSDRPAPKAPQNEAPEAEVTPEMIAAGVDTYAGYFCGLMISDPGTKIAMVTEVYRVMANLAPGRDRRTDR